MAHEPRPIALSEYPEHLREQVEDYLAGLRFTEGTPTEYDPTVPEVDTSEEHLAAIEQDRNDDDKGADWQFTTDQARIKLKRLYPSFEVR